MSSVLHCQETTKAKIDSEVILRSPSEYFKAIDRLPLKPSAKWVLRQLFSFRNSKTGACYPSIKELAKRCHLSKPTVRRHIRCAEDIGWLFVADSKRNNGSQTSSRYDLTEVAFKAENIPVKNSQNAPRRPSIIFGKFCKAPPLQKCEAPLSNLRGLELLGSKFNTNVLNSSPPELPCETSNEIEKSEEEKKWILFFEESRQLKIHLCEQDKYKFIADANNANLTVDFCVKSLTAILRSPFLRDTTFSLRRIFHLKNALRIDNINKIKFTKNYHQGFDLLDDPDLKKSGFTLQEILDWLQITVEPNLANPYKQPEAYLEAHNDKINQPMNEPKSVMGEEVKSIQHNESKPEAVKSENKALEMVGAASILAKTFPAKREQRKHNQEAIETIKLRNQLVIKLMPMLIHKEFESAIFGILSKASYDLLLHYRQNLSELVTEAKNLLPVAA